jgi:glutamyl-tRNA reductase
VAGGVGGRLGHLLLDVGAGLLSAVAGRDQLAQQVKWATAELVTTSDQLEHVTEVHDDALNSTTPRDAALAYLADV